MFEQTLIHSIILCWLTGTMTFRSSLSNISCQGLRSMCLCVYVETYYTNYLSIVCLHDCLEFNVDGIIVAHTSIIKKEALFQCFVCHLTNNKLYNCISRNCLWHTDNINSLSVQKQFQWTNVYFETEGEAVTTIRVFMRFYS